MNKTVCLFAGIICIGCFVSASGESFLKAVSFPKSFNDVSFIDRIRVLTDDYINFETIYDTEGKCISGCAYPGITLEDEMVAIRRNTERANSAIDAHRIAQQMAQSETGSIPSTGDDVSISTTSGSLEILQPGQQNPSTLAQTCSSYPVFKDTDIPWNPPVAVNIKISSDFGPRVAPIKGATDLHQGIDIAVPEGTPVYATANGEIEYIRDQGSERGGKYVVVKHSDGFRTGYFHLSNNQVKKVGDKVKAGDIIGISGNTGNSTGPHLDYRVFYTQPNKKFDWEVIDPLWVKNVLDTQYEFKNQSVKSCLHDPKNFCSEKKYASRQLPPETLPCEIK